MDETLVLGLGNILCGDEGIGCRVAEYLYASRIFPDHVIIADGGTMGQELLGPVMDASNLLIIDCGDFGIEPAQTLVRKNTQVPVWLGVAKMSPHQGAFAEVLALAQLKNRLPKNIFLLAIQPEKLEFGARLSLALRCRIPEYALKAETILREWGIAGVKREMLAFLSDAPVALQNYEPECIQYACRSTGGQTHLLF